MINQEKLSDNKDKILHDWIKDQVLYRIRVLSGLNWKVLQIKETHMELKL